MELNAAAAWNAGTHRCTSSESQRQRHLPADLVASCHQRLLGGLLSSTSGLQQAEGHIV